MLSHVDFDRESTHASSEVSLPDIVESISITYDGGHIVIAVNDETLYETSIGTHDCSILITK